VGAPVFIRHYRFRIRHPYPRLPTHGGQTTAVLTGQASRVLFYSTLQAMAVFALVLSHRGSCRQQECRVGRVLLLLQRVPSGLLVIGAHQPVEMGHGTCHEVVVNLM
jgi:hypothetical protein